MTINPPTPHSPETAAQSWQKAMEAAQRGDTLGAEQWFRHCHSLQPSYPNAALNAGILAMERGALKEAEPFLRQAAANQPTIESIGAWGQLHEKAGKLEEAKKYYWHILKAAPNHHPTLRRMGDVFERAGERAMAKAYFRKAVDANPSDVDTAIKLAIALWEDDPAETVRMLDEGLVRFANDDARRQALLGGLLLYKEFYERIKRGLMPYHGSSIDDLFFTFSAKDFALYRKLALELAAAKPTNKNALLGKAIALFCSRDREGAQAVLDQLRPSGNIWEAVSFDPVFYRALESMTDADLLKGLPPLLQVIPGAFDDRPVAYLSCNYTYFAGFGIPMLRSLADKSPGAQVHMHIMDISDAELATTVDLCRDLDLRIGLSIEQPGVDKKGQMEARCYYHAIRFIRYYQHLLQYQRTLWLMDVDALFNRDPQEMYSVLGDNDVAFRIRAGRFEPWNQFNACIVAATPKAPSVLYFRLLAAYIARFYQEGRLRWGIDQLAMYGVFEHLRDEKRAPALAFLGNRAIDYEYLDDGIVWCNSGKNKFFHLKRNPDGSLIVDDPDRAKYLQLFDKYYLPAKP